MSIGQAKRDEASSDEDTEDLRTDFSSTSGTIGGASIQGI